MKLIRIDENNKVTSYHSNPHLLSDEERQNGIMVDTIPETEYRKGKSANLFYDKSTNSVYVEYVDRPLTQEELMGDMKNDIDYLVLKQEGLI